MPIPRFRQTILAGVVLAASACATGANRDAIPTLGGTIPLSDATRSLIAVLSQVRGNGATILMRGRHDSTTLSLLRTMVTRIAEASETRILDTTVITMGRARPSSQDFLVEVSVNRAYMGPNGCIGASGNTTLFVVRCTGDLCTPDPVRRTSGSSACVRRAADGQEGSGVRGVPR